MKFKDGEVEGVSVVARKKFCDKRGELIETFRQDELGKDFFPVMAYVSMTLPGVVRGPHEHKEQADLFVFLGPGEFKVYLWDWRKNSPTYLNRQVLIAGEKNPVQVVVPPGVVHAYQCISSVAGIVHNFPNRLFAGVGKKGSVDEVRHEDNPDSPFKIEK